MTAAQTQAASSHNRTGASPAKLTTRARALTSVVDCLDWEGQFDPGAVTDSMGGRLHRDRLDIRLGYRKNCRRAV